MKKTLPLLGLCLVLGAGCRTNFCHHDGHRHTRGHAHKCAATPLDGRDHRDGTKTQAHGSGVSTPLPAHFPALPERPPKEVRDSYVTNVAEGERIELKAEDLTVDKRRVSNGAVRIRKYVVSETKSVPVEVCREDYVIERVPASGAPSTPWGTTETYIDLPVTRDEVKAVITPRVYETLRIRKTVDCVTEQVSGVVRTEKYEVLKGP